MILFLSLILFLVFSCTLECISSEFRKTDSEQKGYNPLSKIFNTGGVTAEKIYYYIVRIVYSQEYPETTDNDIRLFSLKKKIIQIEKILKPR